MKRGSGNSLLALGIFFIFFMLFILLNHRNINDITGMAVDDTEISVIQDVKILRLTLDEDNQILDSSEENFESGDTLGCRVEYTGTGILNINFLSQGDSIDAPKEQYKDVLNIANTNVINESTADKNIITGIYQPLNDYPGKWSCMATFNDINNASSNTIEMLATANVQAVNNTNVTQQIITCTSLWDCNWGECTNGKQTCAYYDRNSCDDQTSKPQDLENQCSVQVTEDVSQQKKDIIANVNVESKSNVLLIPIILFALGIISLGGYFIIKKLKDKKNTIQPLKTTIIQPDLPAPPQIVQQANPMQNYIENAIKQGQGVQQIKTDLEKAGWNKKDIDDTINYCTLKKFVNDKKQQGFTKEKITESLKSKGWKDEMINKIFQELKI
mgnify:FL=1